MGRWMLHRRGQLLSRVASRPSFAGRGLVDRMRSTAFALLGATTAIALGLVALISHQSWPYLPVGPVPSYQAERGKLGGAVALVPGATRLGIAPRDVPVSGSSGRAPAGTGRRQPGLAGFRPVHPQAAPAPAPGQSDGVGVPAPAAAGTVPPIRTPEPASAPTPAPAPAAQAPVVPAATPTTPSPTTTSGPGKGHAYGREKANAGPKPKPSPPAPAATVPAAAPSSPAVEAEPPAASPPTSAGPGNGNGHAYGHDK
jgi:hypothetical protein